jgi:16S rRNA (cytidine1402-2'-O)-methyltransferase
MNPPTLFATHTGQWAEQIQSLTGLFLVATPIGHIEDISLRALSTLANVHGILCEDTRQTRILLAHYGISTPCYAYHAHNEHRKQAGILHLLHQGKRLALVSDRGTPLMSDPGFPLVRACYAHSIDVHALPGASSILTALTLSGLPCSPFFFQGFLPTRKRQATLDFLSTLPCTLVIFESPHRLAETLKELSLCFQERPACLLRELTKKFQERIALPLDHLAQWAANAAHIGECVLVIQGRTTKDCTPHPSPLIP